LERVRGGPSLPSNHPPAALDFQTNIFPQGAIHEILTDAWTTQSLGFHVVETRSLGPGQLAGQLEGRDGPPRTLSKRPVLG
jgi:hypothetical protein